MSDAERSGSEAGGPEEVEEEEMDIAKVIKEVIKKALFSDGLARGLHEAAKVMDAGNAQVCFLADDCNEPTYSKLVKALCNEHDVSLVTVPTRLDLGEMVGLCKYDSEGKPRKVTPCSCAVIKDFGEESDYLNKFKEYLEQQKA